jgi:hypothetical protein
VTLAQARAAVLAAVPAEHRRRALAYIDEQPFGSGEVVYIDRNPETVPRDFFFGFIDLSPHLNWAHECLYVLCDVAGMATEIRAGRLPPVIGPGRHLTPIASDAAP